MKCPYCGSENSKVLDSRHVEENNSIRRRRICDECGKRFTTYEKVETLPVLVIKKDLSREPYRREKIEAGIVRACHKRAVSLDQMASLIDDVENEIYNMEEKEIKSSVIGEIVIEKLKKLDTVAYVRFISVNREFKDADAFLDEIKKIVEDRAL